MNILFNSFNTESKRQTIKKLSELIDINTIYISDDTNLQFIKNCNVVKFIENKLPFDTKPSFIGFDIDVFETYKGLEADFIYLLNRFTPSRSGYLSMLDKEIRKAHFNQYHVVSYTPIQSKRIFHLYLIKWLDFYSKNEVDLFISTHVPHEPERYIMYMVAKQLKIKTILMSFTPFYDQIIIENDFNHDYKCIQDSFIKYLNTDNPIESIRLSESMSKHYSKKTDKSFIDEKPFYMENGFFNKHTSLMQKLSKSIKRVVPNPLKIFDIDYLYYKIKGVDTLKYKKDSLKFFDQHAQSLSQINCKFIYFPLHVQPELTTFPLGKSFTDLMLVIDLLSESLPDKWRIVVKEHPNQVKVNGTRDPLLYWELIKHPKVIIAKTNENSLSLIKQAEAIVTLTGTVIYEAMFLNKFGLMFGYHSNSSLPNTLLIRNNEDVNIAINKIQEETYLFSESKYKCLVKAFEENSTHAFIDDVIKKGTDLSDEECSTNITNSLVKLIKENESNGCINSNSKL